MTRFNKIILFFLMILNVMIAVCQPGKPLGINSAIDLDSVESLRQFKSKKLIIIDFLSTYCTSCIEKIPEYELLQQRFNRDIQIVIVTDEDSFKVSNFFRVHPGIIRLKNLRIVTGDSILNSFFPHWYIPHIVFIKQGIVKAITDPEYVNSRSIKDILDVSDNISGWVSKQDNGNFNYSMHLMYAGAEVGDVWQRFSKFTADTFKRQQFYNSVTSYLPGVARACTYNHYDKTLFIADSNLYSVRGYMINYPIIDMYVMAFGLPVRLPKYRIVIDSYKKDQLVYDSSYGYKTKWMADNTYCYEGLFPLSSCIEQRRSSLVSSLNAFFGLNGRIENRLMKCLIIKAANANNTVLLKKEPDSLSKDNVVEKFVSLTGMISRLDYQMGVHVIDQTGYINKRYLRLPENAYTDIHLLEKELAKYGLHVLNGICSIDLLIISDNEE